MRYTPSTILVTGGAGFIGSNFVHHMLRADHIVRIVNLDLLTYAGTLDNLTDLPAPERHVFVHGDICDSSLVAQLFDEHRIDTVVHFAAQSHVDRSIADPGEFVRTNVHGTFTLLEAARSAWLGAKGVKPAEVARTRRFHHISTDEVFGSLTPEDPPFAETTPYAPNSPYSASKAASDHLVRAYFHTYGLPVVTTNCSNNYGPRQHAEKFIPTVIRNCLEGERVPVYGDGQNIRDWLYVDDHCRAIQRVLTHGELGQTYNIGGCNEWRNNDVVSLICRLLDERQPGQAPHERLVEFVTDRAGHDRRYAIDTKKITGALDWGPAEDFESGITKTIDWQLGLTQ
ncbi:dTDP-glucose 4,6-dehydratase [Paraburkholderia phenoliruptrix]|uniref:dTDP-glucose 4,6-dehydratase n=2 Tax=Paraburkholderia phenoliruptrix TaxID=252970 RepID=K0E2V4_9BURK|nr:dTDP-glucose 4,6-dehydratase [Paraburkholderia phenoliruptrix]AFT90109.1 dTDP-glucose 4,6-dehydratase [Paraburkholderia phenoliruptrix BR3459a]CAB4052746.1 dTDP-glucose 4,6-dehydratase [Paraburkholderia phenoliruptrix]